MPRRVPAQLATIAVLASLFAFVIAGCGRRDDGAGNLWRIPAIAEQVR